MNNELTCYSIFINNPFSVDASINKCICKDFCFVGGKNAIFNYYIQHNYYIMKLPKEGDSFIILQIRAIRFTLTK